MKRLWSVPAGFAAVSLCLVMAPAAVAQKVVNQKAHEATAQEYILLNSVKDVRGTVDSVSTNSSGTTLTITVDTSHTEVVQGSTPNTTIKPNVGGARAEARDVVRVQQDMAKLQQELVRLQQAELQLANSKNPKDAAAKRNKLQQEMNKVKQDYVKLEKDLAHLQQQEVKNAIHDQRVFQQALAKYAKSQKNYIINATLTFELVIAEKAAVSTSGGSSGTSDKSPTVADIVAGQNVHIYLTPDKSTKPGADGPRPTVNKIVILADGGSKK